nr:leucine-rich repeat domain-containing protein [uncultured Bacteroides sp.]
MKQTLLFIIIISLFTVGCSHDEIEYGVLKNGKMVLNVDSAGTLSKLISTTDKYSITDLTLSGKINGKDIMLIHNMAGLDSLGHVTAGRLTKINMENVNIVAGGYFYFKAYAKNNYGLPIWSIGRANVLKNDELPDFIFFGLDKITEVILPKDINYISENAFANCSELTTVGIPDKITYIGSAFFNCPKLKSMKLPGELVSIGSNAFLNCAGLTSVTIGNKVTLIGINSFSDCFLLEEIHCKALTPPKTDSSAFSTYTLLYCKLYIPKGSSKAYKSAEVWKDFVNVIEE